VSFTTTTPSRSVLHSSDAGRRPETLFGPAITGGQSSSNLPSHTIVYPSYGDAKSPGVLIASYTWTQDADRMTPVSHEERVRICMNDLVKVHGEAVRDEVIVETFSHSWYEDEHSQGAFALFAAGQFNSLFNDAIAPAMKDRLHFAGEATSVHHAWVVGALNSAYRTVVEILMTLPDGEREVYLEKLATSWGEVDEIEIEM
jgi:monoamine oxidase